MSTNSEVIIPGTTFTIDWLIDKLTTSNEIDQPPTRPIRNELIDWSVGSPCTGVGHMSKITAVNLQWSGSHNTTDLPNKLIIKVVEGNDEETEFIGGLHKAECTFYELLRSSALKFLPKTYYLQPEPVVSDTIPGVILMENLVQNTFHVKVQNGLTVEQVQSVAQSLAQLHAEILGGNIQENWPHLISKKREPSMDVCVDYWQQLLKLAPDQFRGVEQVLPSIFHRIISDKHSTLRMKLINSAAQYLDQPTVVSHGDLWLDNMMFQTDKPNQLSGMIDWQFAHPGNVLHSITNLPSFAIVSDRKKLLAHLGSVCEDLSTLIAMSLSAEDRRKHSASIYQNYHETLISILGADKVCLSVLDLTVAGEYVMPHSVLWWAAQSIMDITSGKVHTQQEINYICRNIRAFLDDFANVNQKTKELWTKFEDDQRTS